MMRTRRRKAPAAPRMPSSENTTEVSSATARRPPPRWIGRFVFDAGLALYVGKALDTTRHAHHALQVCIGLDGPVRLRVQAERRWRLYDAAIIRADAPDELASDGQPMGLLFVEPEGPDGCLRQLPIGRDVMSLAASRCAICDCC